MTLHTVPTLATASPLISVSPSNKTSKPVSFYIQALDYNVGINILGNLAISNPTLPQCDAECVFNVQVGLLQSVFKLWLDDMSIDFTDASSNARYYVFTKNWINMDMNMANALVIDGAIATVSNKQLMLTKQDFLRYLAQNLFGTYLGTDLFSNEQGLLNDIGVQAHNAWTTQMNILNKVAASADAIVSVSDPSYTTTLQTYPYLKIDANGKKYLTNADTTANNITYQLMSMINQTDPGRLAIDFSNQVIGADGIASVPFRAGDSLFFYTNLAPAQGQELLTGVPTIQTRKYALKINIIGNNATPANPIPLEYNSALVKKYSEYCLGNITTISSSSYLLNSDPTLAYYYRFSSGDVNGNRIGSYATGTLNYNATLFNGASIVPNKFTINGQSYSSLYLNGPLSQYINIDPFTMGTTGLTFSFWINTITNPNWGRVFDFGNDLYGNTSNKQAVNFTVNTNTSTYYGAEVLVDGGYYNEPELNKVFVNNVWNHIVWTLSYAPNNSSTSIWNFYVNGILFNQFRNAPAGPVTSYYPKNVNRINNFIGKSDWGNDTAHYNGYMNEFRIYNRVLSENDVASLYTYSPAG